MSATSCLLSEEQFLCCICLDVFTDPVTIQCGHNFCKNCITQHWSANSGCYQCPMCKKHFDRRPELQINTFISEMAAEFRKSTAKQGSEMQVAKQGEVPCDICAGKKLKALKSCLTCFASYCHVHLAPHLTADPLKRHLLADPVENIEGMVCAEHKKPLELFCKTDQTFVCSLCTVSQHMAHDIVCLKEEYEAKSAKLKQVDAEIKQMLHERQMKLQLIKRVKRRSKEDTEREVAHGVRIFTLLMQTAERRLNELIEVTEKRQKTMDEEAGGFIRELDQEMSALMARTVKVQQLLHSQDHHRLLQSFESVSVVPRTKNWTNIIVHLPSNEETVLNAVGELEETLSREKQRLLQDAGLQRYAVDVILDPRTANPWLILSDDGKQVSCGEVRRDLPDTKDRFSLYATVLAQQSFSSGRFYYEVQVTGKTDWTLGVVKSSVNRKGIIPISPLNGYWAVGLRNGNEYLSLASPVVSLRLNSGPQRVGVYVSYQEGLVSFYDTDATVHLYSFTDCCFTEELYPFFSPGLHHGGMNAAPLIILPVNHTENI